MVNSDEKKTLLGINTDDLDVSDEIPDVSEAAKQVSQILDWDIPLDQGEKNNIPPNDKELEKRREVQKQINALFRVAPSYREELRKLLGIYPDKQDELNSFFAQIGIIHLSKLHSKKRIIGLLISLLSHRNYVGFLNYENHLFNNGEGKAGFPKEIFMAIRDIDKIFRNIIPGAEKDYLEYLHAAHGTGWNRLHR